MSSNLVGPQIPPHILAKRKRAADRADDAGLPPRSAFSWSPHRFASPRDRALEIAPQWRLLRQDVVHATNGLQRLAHI